MSTFGTKEDINRLCTFFSEAETQLHELMNVKVIDAIDEKFLFFSFSFNQTLVLMFLAEYVLDKLLTKQTKWILFDQSFDQHGHLYAWTVRLRKGSLQCTMFEHLPVRSQSTLIPLLTQFS